MFKTRVQKIVFLDEPRAQSWLIKKDLKSQLQSYPELEALLSDSEASWNYIFKQHSKLTGRHIGCLTSNSLLE